DDVEAGGAEQVAAHRPGPRAEAARRASEQPVERPLGDAVLLEQPAKVADPAVRLARPGEQIVEIALEAGDAVPLHFEPQIAPGAGLRGAEIIVGNVESADDHPPPVGQRELLVVAKHVAPPEARAEPAEGGGAVDQRL